MSHVYVMKKCKEIWHKHASGEMDYDAFQVEMKKNGLVTKRTVPQKHKPSQISLFVS